jgi:myo-inositol-1(or 4)-monophosphatase
MLNTAIAAAREAGAYLKESVGKVRSIEIKKGEERNLVSEIDRTSEAKIISMIRSRYPTHGFLGEEGGGVNTEAEYRWVIDPLDGTTNFLHGLPIFCVTIGLEYRGEIVAGVVYDPNREELFTTEKGSGAFLNGDRLAVSPHDELIRSLLVTGFPYNIAENPDNAIERFNAFLMAARGVRRLGSAALDLCYVACGRLDGFWEVQLHPWDMAAGILMVTEAGGAVTDFTGGPMSIYRKDIVASNGKIHRLMLEVIRKTEK